MTVISGLMVAILMVVVVVRRLVCGIGLKGVLAINAEVWYRLGIWWQGMMVIVIVTGGCSFYCVALSPTSGVGRIPPEGRGRQQNYNHQ